MHEHYRGFKIRIEQDDCRGDGPRDWSNLGTMVCFHGRNILGDTGGDPRWRERKNRAGEVIPSEFPVFLTPDDFREYVQKDNEVALSIPLILAEHGNMWMSTTRDRYPFNCPWDSGQVGWIYVTMETLIHEYHSTGACDMKTEEGAEDAMNRAERYLLGEVEAYSQYLSGDVYGYTVEDRRGEQLDSCWGYYGHDFETNRLLEDARRYIDWHLAKAYKDRAQQVMAWIREGVPHIYRTPMVV